MARGGRRTGAPAAQYPNRTDMQLAPRAAPGQTYGEAGAQIAAQRALPIGPPPAPAAPAPGSLGALDRESDRPQLPVTAGADIGPGPGSEALGLGPASPTPLDILRALYQRHPNEDLRDLLEDHDVGGF